MHKGFFRQGTPRTSIFTSFNSRSRSQSRSGGKGGFPSRYPRSTQCSPARRRKGSISSPSWEMEEGLDVQLVVRPEIKSFEDLRGKLFAADPVSNSNYDLIRNKIMRDHGVTEDQYRIDILGSSRHRAEAFAAGRSRPRCSRRRSRNGRWRAAGVGVLSRKAADYVSPTGRLLAAGGYGVGSRPIRSTVVRLVRAMASSTDWLRRFPGDRRSHRPVSVERRCRRARAALASCWIGRTKGVRRNPSMNIDSMRSDMAAAGRHSYDASFSSATDAQSARRG